MCRILNVSVLADTGLFQHKSHSKRSRLYMSVSSLHWKYSTASAWSSCETHSRDLAYGTKTVEIQVVGNAVTGADIRPSAMFPWSVSNWDIFTIWQLFGYYCHILLYICRNIMMPHYNKRPLVHLLPWPFATHSIQKLVTLFQSKIMQRSVWGTIDHVLHIEYYAGCDAYQAMCQYLKCDYPETND